MLSFIEPQYLWLLALVPLLLWLGWVNRQRLGRTRTLLSLVLRLCMLVALIGSLAGTQLVRPVKQLTTIFLVDVSDSVSPNQRAQQEQFIAEALETMPDGDQAAIVLFGENAQIERIPSPEKRLGRLQAIPVAARTNIEQALTLGLALFPSDTQKRLVLLSDGGENSGRALNTLRLAQQRDATIDVVQVQAVSGNEVALTSLQAPSQARSGQEIALLATIESSSDQAAILRFTVDNQSIIEQPIELRSGTQEYTATVELEAQGYHHLMAEVVPTDDIRLQNNRVISLINVLGEPRILVVAQTPADGQVIETALSAAGLVPTLVLAENMPFSLAEFAEYEAVVLANVPAREFPEDTLQALQSYVRDLGYGLVVIGGSDSYGIGGYGDTLLEEILPVEMDLRNQEKYPQVSVAISFDISGSMTESIGGRQKVEIAAEGAARVVQLLRDFDEITVIPFDSAAQNAYGPVAGSERDTAVDEIIARGVAGGGGIAVNSALKDAYNRMKDRTAPIRHVIILADGSDSQEQEGSVELAQRMRKDGITVSTVAIGNGGDVGFLKAVATAGGGRSFMVENAIDLPDILLQEAQLALAPYLIEQQFLPLLGNDSPVMADLINRSWPSIYGMVGTTPKEEATVVLWGPDDLPLLTQWQYGLGRSVAWTSDFKGQWAKDLIAWEHAPRLIAQMVGWTLPVVSGDTVNLETTFIGSELEITLFASDEQAQPLTGHSIAVNIVGGEGIVEAVNLDEVGSGVYRGRVASPQTGTYFLQIGARDAEGRSVFQRTSGLIVPYSPEYRQGQANPQLLGSLAEETSGRVLEQPIEVFTHNLDAVRRTTPIHFFLLVLALLLLPLDIAIRRLRWRSLREGVAARKKPPAQPQMMPAGMTQLQQARQRAQQTYTPSENAAREDSAAPVYQAAPPPPPRSAPPPPEPAPQPQAAPPPPQAAPAPTLGPQPSAVDLDQIEDPLERLRAAKNRARRR